jgi:hypothetical protein
MICLRTALTSFIILASVACNYAQQKDTSAGAPTAAAELAKKLANPIANLISIPFQNNTDYGIGPNQGSRNTLNFQPVIPITLGPKFNLITRMVLPIITQYNVFGQNTKQSGLGNALISAFFSPSTGGLIWGIGPVFMVPTASDPILGPNQFGVGPTAVALKQFNGFTVGALINQLWSVTGNTDSSKLSQFYVQPFFAYNWKSGAGFALSAEISQNWIASTTTATIIPAFSGITRFGRLPVSLQIGPRIPVSAPAGMKPVFGFRAALVVILPK